MKKIAILMVMVLAVSIAFGQKYVRQTASNYLRSGKLDKAREAINQCIKDPITAQDAKTWFLRGAIYQELMNKEGKLNVGMTGKEVESLFGEPKGIIESVFEDTSTELWEYNDLYIHFSDNKVVGWTRFKDRENQASEKEFQNKNLLSSLESFKKAIEYDIKKKYYEDIINRLHRQRNNLYNLGAGAYNQAINAVNANQPEFAIENYRSAMNYFAGAVDVLAVADLVDTTAMLNTALCATFAKDYENAKKYYFMLLEKNHKTPSLFVRLSSIYREQEDLENALKIIQQGKEAFPGDPDIFLGELNVFLTFNLRDQALSKLLKYIETDTTNYSIYFALGTVYDKIVNDTIITDEAVKEDAFEKAIKAYNRSLTLNPEYFDAYINIGALYVNLASQINNEANLLPVTEDVEYDRLIKETNHYLELAAPSLEKAVSMQPDDVYVLQTLRQIYARTKQKEKLQEVNAKIDSITQ